MNAPDKTISTLRSTLLVDIAASIVAAILVIAASLKLSAAFTDVYHFGSTFDSGDRFYYAVAFLEVACEVIGGLCLWTFRSRRTAWALTGLAFFMFFGVALSRGLQQLRICDCFGTVLVQPYYTAAMDLFISMICFAMSFFMPRNDVGPSTFRGVGVAAFVGLAFLSASAGALFLKETSRVAAEFMGTPIIVGRLQLQDQSKPASFGDAVLLLGTRGQRSIEVLGIEKTCGYKTSGTFPVKVGEIIGRISLSIKRPTTGKTELLSVTLLINDSGVLKKARLKLRTSRVPV